MSLLMDANNKNAIFKPSVHDEFRRGQTPEVEDEFHSDFNSVGEMDSEENLAWDSQNQQNPLLFSEILSILVQYLDYPTLKDCRLVCSKWNEGMFTRFQKRTQLDAKFTISIVNKSIPDFVSTYLAPVDSGQFFFTNIKIYQPQYLHHPLFQEWFRSYGKYLLSMELGCTNDEAFEQWSYLENPNSYSYHEYLCSNIFHVDSLILQKILLEWCPNLKELKVPRAGLFMECDEKRESTDDEAAVVVTPISKRKPMVALNLLKLSLEHHGVLEPLLKDILGLVCSVNTLKLEGCADEQGMRELILSEQLKPIGEDSDGPSSFYPSTSCSGSVSASLQSVVHLDVEQFGFKTPSTALATISSIKFRNLKLLKMKLSQLNSFSFEDTKYLMEVLEGEPFARLELVTLGYINFPRGLTFPKLRYLKRICLCIDSWEENLDFLLQLPHLAVLGFNKKRNGELPHLLQLFAPKSKLRKLKHWKIKCVEFSCTPGDEFEGIVESFPNVEIMRIQPSTEIEKVLSPLSKCRKLKELAIIQFGEMKNFEKAVCDNLPDFKDLERFYCGSKSSATQLSENLFTQGILKTSMLRSYQLDFAYEAPPDYPEIVKQLLMQQNKVHGELLNGDGSRIKERFMLYTHRPQGFSWD